MLQMIDTTGNKKVKTLFFNYNSKSKNNYQKNGFPNIITKNNINFKFHKIVNFIFVLLIFALLLKDILSYNIEIKTNKIGLNKIISDEFNNLPNYVYINGYSRNLNGKSIIVQSTDDTIILRWSNPLRNLSYLFNNLANIVYAHLIYINNDNCNMSYMFCNCTNLESFYYSSYYYYDIVDMRRMFYNCLSLKEISFNNFIGYSSYVNMSYLFYNCHSLSNVPCNFNSFDISDTREMFYNCTSLESIYFYPRNVLSEINMTRMFYNCTNIRTITFNTRIFPSDMSEMFYNCNSITELNLNYFRTNYVRYMKYMLYNCKSMNRLYISNTFSNTYITDMRGVFQNCESLITLDLRNFYTQNVEIMWDLFKGCKNLKNLYIQNFDTSKVTDMQSMFNGCSNLTTLNLNHFKTPKVQYMNKMFQNCIQLESIYLSQLTTESLGTMYRMFYNCSKLKYINLFSLDGDVLSFTEMFENTSANFQFCIKDEKNIPNIFNLLLQKPKVTRDCSSSCYGNNNIYRIYASIEKKCCTNLEYNGHCYDQCPIRTTIKNIRYKCENFTCSYFYNYGQRSCSDTRNVPIGYYINDTILKTLDKCDDNCKTCKDNATYCLSCYNNNNPYFYLHKCYNKCKYDSFTDTDGILKCKCFVEKCFKCSEESLKEGKCEKCNEDKGYYPKSTDNNNKFIKCYKQPEEYFLDKNLKIYKPCYPSCEFCDHYGNKLNHFCISCNYKNSYKLPMKDYGANNNFTNCYPRCRYNYYFDENDNYICLNTSGCPSFASFLLYKTKQCVKSCNDKYKYILGKTCYESCPIDSKNISNSSGYYCNLSCPFDRPFEVVEEQICTSYCTIMERYYKQCFTNYEGERTNEVQNLVLSNIREDIVETFDYKFITKDQNVILKENNIVYEITSIQFMNNSNETTNIDLTECEARVKELYNIDEDEPLYILKIDAFIEGKIGPKTEYQLYYPFDKKYLHPLDISQCEGLDMVIKYSVNISEENIDLYDKNSGYYNDICYPYTNSKGADIILKDRQSECINSNNIICEENCNFVGYDSDSKNYKCSCEIKVDLPLISELKIDKNKLYQFMDIRQITNFKVMKCFNLLISKNGLITNIGFYCLFPIFIIYIICLIIFIRKEFKFIKVKIKNIIFAKKHIKINKKKKKKKTKTKKKQKRKSRLIKSRTKLINKKIFQKNINRNNTNKDGKSKKRNKTIIDVNPKDDQSEEKSVKSIKIIMNKNKNDINNSINSPPIKNSLKKNKIRKKIDIIRGKKLRKFDKRSYFQYYISLLKENHLFLKIFNKNDYNSRSIKIILFFSQFISSFSINALFFTEETMHQIYEDEGKFNFIYQLPQIIYSTLISFIIDKISNILALSQEKILDLKRRMKLTKFGVCGKKLIAELKIKFILFFVLNFLLILLYGYYLGCFCAVYKNSQYHLIKDTLISFAIGNITPFGINLLPGLFRLYALSKFSKGKRILYILSKFLQNF